jgi:hypothetical protein
MKKYLITEVMKQELESLLEHHPTQLMELRTLEPVKALTLGEKQRMWSGVGDQLTLKGRVNFYSRAIEHHHFGDLT